MEFYLEVRGWLYRVTLDQRDNNGGFLPAGQDTIKVWSTAANINGILMTDAEAQQNLAANPVQITVVDRS